MSGQKVIIWSQINAGAPSTLSKLCAHWKAIVVTRLASIRRSKTADQSPRESIAVPGYNRAYVLPERLWSIHDQTFKDDEHIVLSDASDAETLSAISPEPADLAHQLIISEQDLRSPCSQWQHSFQSDARLSYRSYLRSSICIPSASTGTLERKSALACLRIADTLTERLYTGGWIVWIDIVRIMTGTVASGFAALSMFWHRSASSRSVCDFRNFGRRGRREDYPCIDWILALKRSPGRIPWLRHTHSQDWEKIIVENFRRLKSSSLKGSTARGLSGALAWNLPIRPCTRSPLRRHFLSGGLA
jgi:hypothetical protein